jgi:4-hydroxy-tetrahydrodipicolinate reductase
MKIGVVGCAGRMGRLVVAEVLGTRGCSLAAGSERPGHPDLGKDVGALAGAAPRNVAVGDDPEAVFRSADTVIDFTAPAASVRHAELAARLGKALVVGTTGLDDAETKALREAGVRTVVVRAANMSVGVNLLLGLTKQVAAVLGPDYDVEIVEMHHRHKVDAPSGTALALGEAAAEGRGVRLAEVAKRARDGLTGARRAGDIGFAALRGGDVVGDHSVIFAADGERIELTHKTSARAVFAKGAVRAALWCRGKPPGFYSMRDVLGLA